MTLRSADHEVMAAAGEWLDAGDAVWLVTVTATWGSSPRPPGSLMAVTADGRSAGSVSGGCLEEGLKARLAQGEFAGRPTQLRFGVTEEETRTLGLPCGGRVELLVEPLAGRTAVAPALDALGCRRQVVRRLDLYENRLEWWAAERSSLPFRFDGRTVEKLFGPCWRLLIIGDGPIARLLAQMAVTLDYEVVICDPRRQNPAWTFPYAVHETRMPDDAVCALADDARSAVVALAHDPKLDDMALMEALRSRAFYVGALGSRRNTALRRERLASLGLSSGELDRLHGPVGLPLGGRLPAEIAVAVAAELTAARNGAPLADVRQGDPAVGQAAW